MYFEALQEDKINEALHIADECVGQNLYSYEDFAKTINDDNKFFFLLKNEEGKIAGYIYFLITSSFEVTSSVNLNANAISFSERCGRIQSVALCEEYRGNGLANKMIDFAVKTLAEKDIDTVYIVCWKPGGVLPLQNALDACSFQYLGTVKDAWYKDENLICPYCKGRCHCSADIYCKNIRRNLEKEGCKTSKEKM